ncbi:hypothetical protein AB5G42_004950 [Salmonella enterica subsp. enterica serovar Teko]
METVTEALKAMGKATAREIAARLGIEVRDALEMLREQQEAGAVEFLNGRYYYLLEDEMEDEMLPETQETSPVSADSGTEAGRIFPAPRFISAEIRRTEAKLKRLIKFREISRELHKPGNRRLLVQFFENNTDSEV